MTVVLKLLYPAGGILKLRRNTAVNCWLAIVPYQHQARCQIIDVYQNTLLYTFKMDHVAKFVCNVFQLSEHHKPSCFSGLLTHTVKLNFDVFLFVFALIFVYFVASAETAADQACHRACHAAAIHNPTLPPQFVQLSNFQITDIKLSEPGNTIENISFLIGASPL